MPNQAQVLYFNKMPTILSIIPRTFINSEVLSSLIMSDQKFNRYLFVCSSILCRDFRLIAIGKVVPLGHRKAFGGGKPKKAPEFVCLVIRLSGGAGG